MALPNNMSRCLLWNSLAAAGIGVPGAFAAHADLVPLTALWGRMIYKLAGHADCDLSFETAAKVAGGMAIGAGTMLAGVKLANSYFSYSGIGTPIAIAFNASTNGVATWLVGKSAGELLLEKDMEDMTEKVLKGLAASLGIFWNPEP